MKHWWKQALIVLASLLVALGFAPLATRYVGRARIKPDARWLAWLTRRYVRSLQWILARRTDAAVLLLAMGFLSWVLLRNKQVTQALFGFTSKFRKPVPFAYYRILDGLQELIRQYLLQHQIPLLTPL